MKLEAIDIPPCRWGEGALWHDGRLLFVDIEGHKVHRFTPATEAVETWQQGERVGFVVPRRGDGFVIGTESGLYTLDESGSTERIADPEPGAPTNRFNDGKCSPDGRLFAGTISMIEQEGAAALYRLDPDHTVHVAFGPVTNSNGIVWSRDGRRCHYIDTPRRAVMAFDYDAASGLLTGPLRNIDTAHLRGLPPDAVPDGMAIDERDRLWVAMCHGGCVVCFDPATGEEVERVTIPALETTSCAFGGAGLDDLYVTTGLHAHIDERDGGKLFRVRGLGVRGVPTPVFAG